MMCFNHGHTEPCPLCTEPVRNIHGRCNETIGRAADELARHDRDHAERTRRLADAEARIAELEHTLSEMSRTRLGRRVEDADDLADLRQFADGVQAGLGTRVEDGTPLRQRLERLALHLAALVAERDRLREAVARAAAELSDADVRVMTDRSGKVIGVVR